MVHNDKIKSVKKILISNIGNLRMEKLIKETSKKDKNINKESSKLKKLEQENEEVKTKKSNNIVYKNNSKQGNLFNYFNKTN